LYNLFYLNFLIFKEDYLELIELKKKIEKKLHNFVIGFFRKENSLIIVINYIFIQLNSLFKSLYLTRKLLIVFLNKIRLNSIINFYLKSNKVKKLILLNLILSKLSFVLDILKYKIDKKNLVNKYKTINILYLLLNCDKTIEFSSTGKIWFIKEIYLTFLLENNLK